MVTPGDLVRGYQIFRDNENEVDNVPPKRLTTYKTTQRHNPEGHDR
jgi:hypothetical protein